MAGLILHLSSRVDRGDTFNPKVFCWREKSQQQPKVYHSGPILMTQNLTLNYMAATDSMITLRFLVVPLNSCIAQLFSENLFKIIIAYTLMNEIFNKYKHKRKICIFVKHGYIQERCDPLTVLKPVYSQALKPDSLHIMIRRLTYLHANWRIQRCPDSQVA
jgi:hypothetical protein